MTRKLRLHRCCKLCLKKKKIKLAEFAVALTLAESGLLDKLILVCQRHWVIWRGKMKKSGYISYPFFYIKDNIGKFNLRIKSL